ncbi:MAG TPA: hypothetical protein VII33_01615 [Nakamurella sp.]
MTEGNRYGRSGHPSKPTRPRKVGPPPADNQPMNLDALPVWAEPVAEPFRRDPAFWRAVYASADALVLVVVAAAASLLLGRLGLPTLVALLPFLLPLALVGWAVKASYRSSRASRVWFRRQAADDGLAAWRDSERAAVARVFVRAMFRNRFQHP